MTIKAQERPNVDPSTWIYLAGFIDADGCLTARRRSPQTRSSKPQTSILITQTYGNVLDQLKSTLRVGHINPHSKGGTARTWRVYGDGDNQWILTHIIPHLRLKQPQAWILLKLIQGVDSPDQVDELLTQLSKLKRKPPTRISRTDMFMRMARTASRRSTCNKASVGAVLVKDNRVVSLGYNGAPKGTPHCLEKGCISDSAGGCLRALHAEANAIIWSMGRAQTEGSQIYCTHEPCLACAKLIAAAGITEVYYETPYRLHEGIELLRECGVNLVHLGEDEI